MAPAAGRRASGAAVLAAQTASLLMFITLQTTAAILALPIIIARAVAGPWVHRAKKKVTLGGDSQSPLGTANVVFYEGLVSHARKLPVRNAFRYPIRIALLNLDDPPSWFVSTGQSVDHMTADEARAMAGTSGPVLLLTNPSVAGYNQNPISVYYCYSKGGAMQVSGRQEQGSSCPSGQSARGSAFLLERCIAEVTSTPWGERVTFVIDHQPPISVTAGDATVRKAMHVSPFMDMHACWQLQAPDPSGGALKLVVKVAHDQHGTNFFYADLVAARASSLPHSRNEEAGIRTLLRYGFQPHRTAIRIYWQAIKLLWLGLSIHPPPSQGYRDKVVEEAQQMGVCPLAAGGAALGALYCWRDALAWPWNVAA